MKTYLSSIPLLIYRLSRRNPDKVAIIDCDLSRYTYRQLNRMADAVSRMFPSADARRIGILSGPGAAQIAAILAILKSGAAYVPLDPALNGAALRRSAQSAGVDFVVADAANASRLGDIPAVVLPAKLEIDETVGYAPLLLDRHAVACAMPSWQGGFEELTSLAVRRHARSLCDQFGISSSDVVLQSSVASSQMFLAEVFATMMKGATLAILPQEKRGYAKAVADFADLTGVTVICGYSTMTADLGLLSRLPSRLRLLLGVASDRLHSTLATFNKAETWRGWFSVSL